MGKNLFFTSPTSNQVGKLKSTEILPFDEMENINEDTAPRPYVNGKVDFSCAFATDYIGSDIARRFYVEIELPMIDYPKLDISFDDSKVKFLDKRTLKTSFLPNGEKTPEPRFVRRFYFETVPTASGKTEITFANGKNSIVVPVVIWNYNDLRRPKKVNGVIFPRRYPINGYIENLKEPVENIPPVGNNPKTLLTPETRATNKDQYDTIQFTMEEAWNVVPDEAMSSRIQCGMDDPVHGDKVFNAGGAFYPYKQLVGEPGHVGELYMINPIDKRRIPDNDIGKGDYSTGTWIDDGFNGVEFNGVLHKYIAHLNWYRGSYSYDLANNLANNYINTGDSKYLDLALVVLCRLAVGHNYIVAMPHHRRSHFNQDWNMHLTDAVPMTVLGNSSFYVHGCAQPSRNDIAREAYEKVFPFLDKSSNVIKFMQDKGFPINNIADLQRFLEENIFHTAIQITQDGMCNTNRPGPQLLFLKLIDTFNYPTKEFVDIALHGDGTYFINGIMMPLFYEGLCRDGVNYESVGGYNVGKVKDLLNIIKVYKKIIEKRPELFDKETYLSSFVSPKLISCIESQIEHQPIASTRLYLGDAGSIPTFGGTIGDFNKIKPNPDVHNFFGDEDVKLFEEAYLYFPTAKNAWALINSGWEPPKDYPHTLEQMKEHAATLSDDWRLRSRLLPGLGISLNRSGKDEYERCLITIYNNVYGGHSNDSTMGLFLDAFQNRLITQWGYPLNWEGWFRCWVTQNTGRHFPYLKNKEQINNVELMGCNELNIDDGPLHISDSFAETILDKSLAASSKTNSERYEILPDGWQRRINVLVDVNDKEFYVLDFYRMFGGKDHWRSMQSLDGEVSVQNLKLQKQPGTIAGENISYDDAQWYESEGDYGYKLLRPLSLLKNVEKCVSPDEPWSVIWDINNSNGLKMKLTGLMPTEVNLADGHDPKNTCDISRRFLMTHQYSKDESDLKSSELNIIEFYRDESVVKNAAYLKVDGCDERGFEPVGCEIRLSNRTDYFILSRDNSIKRMILPNNKSVELIGRIGYIALNNQGEITDMRLICGKKLSYDGNTIVQEVDAYKGEIVDTNYEKWMIDIAPAYANPNELIDKHIYIDRNGVKIGMEVREAKNIDGVTRIKVNYDPLLFIGTSRKFADNWLYYRTHKNFGPPWTNDAAPLSSLRTYFKNTIVGKSGIQYTVNSIGEGGVNIMPSESYNSSAASLEKDFPVGTQLRSYDYGIGNKIEVPLKAF